MYRNRQLLWKMTRAATMTTTRVPINAARLRASASAVVKKENVSSTSSSKRYLSTGTTIQPWSQPMVEAHGDYRQEAFLEKEMAHTNLYGNQDNLPRLPVPKISETLEKLIPTVLPLAKTSQEADNFLEACNKFHKEANELQELLKQRKQNFLNSSWLQNWWNTAGYLDVRDPVVINVSYFFHFADDPTLPPADSAPGIARGASMLYAAAEFRRQVCSGSMPHEVVGRAKTPLCMAQSKYMFNACRIPKQGQDSVVLYDPSRHTHALVSTPEGHFYAVDFISKETGLPLPIEVLKERLEKCLEHSANRSSESPNLAILTSQERNAWAEARDELVKVSGMPEALETLQSAALMLCLDDHDAVTKRDLGEIFLHGYSSNKIHTRWFDKSIQLPVSLGNAKCGLNGEHSMMDGMPVIGLADHITKTTFAEASKRSMELHGGSTRESDEGGVVPIFSDELLIRVAQNDGIMNHIQKAENHFVDLVTRHELDVQTFRGYGSNFIKKSGYSPDAYVQMAMQLATYRLWGEQGGTYEATQVRPFLHGRTETTRSVSTESAAFIKAMGLRPSVPSKNKIELLQKAVGAHVKYLKNASQAMGVDRHLFGLSMLAAEEGKTPALLSDPLHTRARRWRVSTSNLTHPKFENWGYGEVVPDGVGLSYGVHPNMCLFNMTALKEHGWTQRLSHLLEEALLEMQVLVTSEGDAAPRSKL